MMTVALCTLLASSMAQTVEVPFKVTDEAIIVDAVVNGKTVSLMFDTGFSGSVVLIDTINIGKSTGKQVLRDFVGEFEASKVKITSFKLGTLDVKTDDMMAVQQPIGHLSESYNTHTDGIMGFEAVQGQLMEINFEKQRFIFHPKTLDISTRKPDGKSTFLTKLLPIGNGSLVMNVLTAQGKKMRMALDTGNAFFATTHKDVLERVGAWEAGKKPKFMRTSWVGSGPVDSFDMKMSDLTIFGVPVKQSFWSVIDLPSSSAEDDGTIGFQFLKNFNIIVDYDRRYVWLQNFTQKVGNEPEGDVGIIAAFDADQKRVMIYSVAPESPAAKAGLKPGDALLSIGGVDVEGMSRQKIDSILKGAEGSTIRIATSREGNLMRFELKREHLINS